MGHLLSSKVRCRNAAICGKKSRWNLSINGGVRFISIDSYAHSCRIEIKSRTHWCVQTDPNDAWFALSIKQGLAGKSEITITAQENSGAARCARLDFIPDDSSSEAFTLFQAGADEKADDPDYYFYITFGTMPAIYAGLHLLSHNKPSYVFNERSMTFDPTKFPNNAFVFEVADPTVNTRISERNAMCRAFKRRIREINKENPKAVFGVYVDDLRCRISYDWFTAQGIDSSRLKVNLLSDGLTTYDHFHNYFGDIATAEANWNRYASEIESLNWGNHSRHFIKFQIKNRFKSFTWPYYLSTRSNYKLFVQDSTLFESPSPFITKKIAEMHLMDIQPYKLLEALPVTAQKRFYEMSKFDYNKFAKIFNVSSKRNLVIIGTNPIKPGSDQQQFNYVAQIVEKFGDDYNVFFKPHPADKSCESYETSFQGLKLLTKQMPFEIFIWSLLNKIDIIGGYQSSVFLTVPIDKVRFIFAPNAESLVRPLNILFRDATEVDWMQ